MLGNKLTYVKMFLSNRCWAIIYFIFKEVVEDSDEDDEAFDMEEFENQLESGNVSV